MQHFVEVIYGSTLDIECMHEVIIPVLALRQKSFYAASSSVSFGLCTVTVTVTVVPTIDILCGASGC